MWTTSGRATAALLLSDEKDADTLAKREAEMFETALDALVASRV